MEQQIEYFSFFGGLNYHVNMDKSLEDVAVELLSKHYVELSEYIFKLTDYLPQYHRLLTAIAHGDRRLYSAFKRARMSETKGGLAISALQKSNILSLEYSRELPPKKEYPKQKLKKEVREHRISHKIKFQAPFLRFWFYFVTPNEEAIAQGDFTALREKINKHHFSFTAFNFERLSNLYLKMQLRDDPILVSGSYWDRQVEIDLYAEHKSGEIIVGECKWRNHKINKKEVNKLREKCNVLDIKPQHIALFSKRGFSNELINKKSKELLLFTAEDFKSLLL